MSSTIAIDARNLRGEPIGTYIRNLVRSLASLDQRNRYLLLVGPQGSQSLPRLPENFEMVVDRIPCYSLRELLTWSWRLLHLRADVYHSTHYFLPPWVPGRSVVTVHDVVDLLYPAYVPSRIGRLYADRILRHSLRIADRVIATTQSGRHDLIRSFQVDGRKIEVVHQGIDDAFRESLPDDDIERWLQNLGLEQPYVVALASSGRRSNLDLAVRAFHRAKQLSDIPDQLVLLGERGPSDFKIRQRIQDLHLENEVVLLGDVAREALPAVYQGSRLFLWPNLQEDATAPAIEAMASGVPVITTATSALKEIASGYAHLVSPQDLEGIAHAMAQCLTSESHHGSLARLGERRSHDFDWTSAGERTLGVYEELLRDREDAA